MDFKGLDLNLLVAFDALMNERNVSKAAARVGVSQPAMSAALSRLRNLLGDHLFTRTAAGLQPTQRARDLAEPVALALKQIESAFLEKPTFEPTDASFTFSLGVSDYPAFILLPALVRSLETLAPKVKLKVSTFTDRDSAVDLLDSGTIDAAIGVPPTHAEGRIQTRPVLRDLFVTIVRKDSIAARRGMTLASFLELSHVLVSPEGDEFGIVDKVLAKNGQSRSVAMTLPHMFAAPGIVSETDYISTILKGVALASAYREKLVMFPPPVPLEEVFFDLIWHKRNEVHPAQLWIRNLIAQLASYKSVNVA